MMSKLEAGKVKHLLRETILSMCQIHLQYDSELSIEGVLGITLDDRQVMLISIQETLQNSDDVNNADTAAVTNVFGLSEMCCVAETGQQQPEKIFSDDVILLEDSHLSAASPTVTDESVKESFFVKNEQLEEICSVDKTGQQRPQRNFSDDVILLEDSHHSVASPAVTTEGFKYSFIVKNEQFEEPPRTIDSTLHSLSPDKCDNDSVQMLDSVSRRRKRIKPETSKPQTGNVTLQGMSDAWSETEQDLHHSEPHYPETVKNESVSDSTAEMMLNEVSTDNFRISERSQREIDIDRQRQNLPVQRKCNMSLFITETPHTTRRAFDDSGNSFPCPVCGVRLKSSFLLHRHHAIVHQKKLRFMCQLCGARRRDRCDMMEHMASKHHMQGAFPCLKCGQAFNHRRTRNHHQKECSEIPVQQSIYDTTE